VAQTTHHPNSTERWIQKGPSPLIEWVLDMMKAYRLSPVAKTSQTARQFQVLLGIYSLFHDVLVHVAKLEISLS
jgi:hypothetical protein